MDAQTRRRERRAEKQAQWKAANPLLVGVSAKPVNRPILSLNRKPKSRVESALNPIDLTVLAEYHEQIESNLQRIERKNQRTWYTHFPEIDPRLRNYRSRYGAISND